MGMMPGGAGTGYGPAAGKAGFLDPQLGVVREMDTRLRVAEVGLEEDGGQIVGLGDAVDGWLRAHPEALILDLVAVDNQVVLIVYREFSRPENRLLRGPQ